MLKNLVAEIAAFFLWLLNITINRTTRLKTVNEEIIDRIHQQGKHVIFAFWHQASFPLLHFYRGKKICIMPITTLPGEIVTRFARRYDCQCIRYPEKGTIGERMESVSKMINTLKKGFDGALTVDGPPGSKLYQAKPGVLLLSQKTGYPLIPIGVFMKRKITLFWRWDKYQIPLPFSKVVIAFGEPLEVPAELEVTELGKKTKELEERIHKLGKYSMNHVL